MLLIQFLSFVIRNIHFVRFLLPVLPFLLGVMQPLCNFRITCRYLSFHSVQHLQRISEAESSHIVRIGILIHHHLEFIRSHYSIIAVIRTISAVITSCGKHAADLNQHLQSVFFRKGSILQNIFIDPDSICHSRGCLKLQAGVLPQITTFPTTDRSNRIKRSFAVQCLCPLSGFLQRCIAEVQQICCRLPVMKQKKRKAIGLGIPKCIAVIRLAGQPFCTDVGPGNRTMISLVHLENAKPYSLLILFISPNFNIRLLPYLLPPHFILFKDCIKSSVKNSLCPDFLLFCQWCYIADNFLQLSALSILQGKGIVLRYQLFFHNRTCSCLPHHTSPKNTAAFHFYVCIFCAAADMTTMFPGRLFLAVPQTHFLCSVGRVKIKSCTYTDLSTISVGCNGNPLRCRLILHHGY